MEESVKYKVSDAQCTGCAACMNVCPRNAIAMAENSEGFLVPGIGPQCNNCGLCAKICPALHPDRSNSDSPACYAYRADDSIRKYSSSGAAFPVLARHILAGGGYVCGAAFDEEYGVSHVIANSLDKLRSMRGSRYVQSGIDYTYRKIRELLNTGAPVLFTGTPCQAAGLKAFLGNAPDNLYVVDLICHGVPSEHVFKMYLAELARGREIKSINFRDKRYGWKPEYTMRIEFDNGEVYEGKSNADPYEKAYASALILRKACADCPFCDYPRQGDLSIGDFWGYGQIAHGDKDANGTSLVLVNNARGEKLLAALERSKKYLKKHDVDPRSLPNRVKAKSWVSPFRERFFDLVKYRPFADAVRYCLDKYYDVGIVGPWANKNIGGFLTYYALYHAIRDMGYSAQMIESPLSADWGGWTNLDGFSDAPLYPAYALCEPSADNLAMRRLNKRFGQFVVGSDQIFYPPLYKGWGRYMRLDWVEDCKKKIAYGSSFGHHDLVLEDDVREELSYYLRKFDAFGVRETSGVKICREQLGVEAVPVLDPVFLCHEKRYADLAARASIQNSPEDSFLHGYILFPNEGKQKLIEAVCEARGLDHRVYAGYGEEKSFGLELLKERLNGRLRDMRDCKFSVTDSFHGLCFAIIFRKDFIVWGERSRAYTRFVSILEDADLMGRLVHNLDEFIQRKDELLAPIDYNRVYEKLGPIIEQDRKWLKTHLEESRIKTPSDFDMSMRMLVSIKQKYDNAINAQKEKITNQEKQLGAQMETLKTLEKRIQEQDKIISENIDRLSQVPEPFAKVFAAGLSALTDCLAYLAAIYAMRKRIIVIAAVNDTGTNTRNPEIRDALAKLGLRANLNEHFRHGYIAIINGGDVAAELVGGDGEEIKYEGALDDGRRLSVVSAPYGPGCGAHILISGQDLSVNRRGLNIVVLDKSAGVLLDTVNFDVYLDEAPASRPGRV